MIERYESEPVGKCMVCGQPIYDDLPHYRFQSFIDKMQGETKLRTEDIRLEDICCGCFGEWFGYYVEVTEPEIEEE